MVGKRSPKWCIMPYTTEKQGKCPQSTTMHRKILHPRPTSWIHGVQWKCVIWFTGERESKRISDVSTLLRNGISNRRVSDPTGWRLNQRATNSSLKKHYKKAKNFDESPRIGFKFEKCLRKRTMSYMDIRELRNK